MKQKINSEILLGLSALTIIGLVFTTYQVNTNLAASLNIDQGKPDTVNIIITIVYLVSFVFHVYALIYIFLNIRRFDGIQMLKGTITIIGVLSFISFLGEKVMIDEIAGQYRAGLLINELRILNLFYAINILFCAGMLFLLTKVINSGKSQERHL